MRKEPELAASYRFCAQDRSNARRKNFYHAFRLLPRTRRQSMNATLRVHAAYRRPGRRVPAAPARRTRRYDSGRPSSTRRWRPSPWRGRGSLPWQIPSRATAIPAVLLDEVIEGVSMDIQPRRSPPFADLADYCYHVASVVGIELSAYLGISLGWRQGRAAGRSIAVSRLQLTNILRDVREDARNGRIYLPRDETWPGSASSRAILTPTGPPRDFVICWSSRQSARSPITSRRRELVPLVDPVGRPVLLTIVGIYRALLDEIARRNYNVLGTRVAVPTWRKAAIALRALPRRFLGQPIKTSQTPGTLNQESPVGPMAQVPKPPPPHVVIVGGGLAGLATAVGLTGRGLRITLLESRPQAGWAGQLVRRPGHRRAGR